MVICPDLLRYPLADRRYNLRRSYHRGMDVLPRMGSIQSSDPRSLIGGLTWRPIYFMSFADVSASATNRKAQNYARRGITFDQSTLADWISRAAFLLEPVDDRQLASLSASLTLFADKTTAPRSTPSALTFARPTAPPTCRRALEARRRNGRPSPKTRASVVKKVAAADVRYSSQTRCSQIAPDISMQCQSVLLSTRDEAGLRSAVRYSEIPATQDDFLAQPSTIYRQQNKVQREDGVDMRQCSERRKQDIARNRNAA